MDYDKELSEVYVDRFQSWTHKWADSENGILNLKTRL